MRKLYGFLINFTYILEESRSNFENFKDNFGNVGLRILRNSGKQVMFRRNLRKISKKKKKSGKTKET